MNLIEQRLNSLELNFREEKRANRGFKLLFKLIKNDNDELKNLLRDNKISGIYEDEEIDSRDNIDFALAFLSILAMAVRINYISIDIVIKRYKKELDLLNNKHVKKYFTEYYPLPLLIWFSNYKNLRYGTKSCSIPTSITFEFFLYLLRSRMDDKCIDQFLWFLDDGKTLDENGKYIGIHSFWKIIDEINNGRDKNFTTLFKDSFVGFTNFIIHMEHLTKLMKSSSNKVLSSLIWTYESYWFVSLKNEISDNIIARVIKYYEKNSTNTVNQNVSETEIQKTIENIKYLLNYDYGDYYKIQTSANRLHKKLP